MVDAFFLMDPKDENDEFLFGRIDVKTYKIVK